MATATATSVVGILKKNTPAGGRIRSSCGYHHQRHQACPDNCEGRKIHPPTPHIPIRDKFSPGCTQCQLIFSGQRKMVMTSSANNNSSSSSSNSNNTTLTSPQISAQQQILSQQMQMRSPMQSQQINQIIPPQKRIHLSPQLSSSHNSPRDAIPSISLSPSPPLESSPNLNPTFLSIKPPHNFFPLRLIPQTMNPPLSSRGPPSHTNSNGPTLINSNATRIPVSPRNQQVVGLATLTHEVEQEILQQKTQDLLSQRKNIDLESKKLSEMSAEISRLRTEQEKELIRLHQHQRILDYQTHQQEQESRRIQHFQHELEGARAQQESFRQELIMRKEKLVLKAKALGDSSLKLPSHIPSLPLPVAPLIGTYKGFSFNASDVINLLPTPIKSVSLNPQNGVKNNNNNNSNNNSNNNNNKRPFSSLSNDNEEWTLPSLVWPSSNNKISSILSPQTLPSIIKESGSAHSSPAFHPKSPITPPLASGHSSPTITPPRNYNEDFLQLITRSPKNNNNNNINNNINNINNNNNSPFVQPLISISTLGNKHPSMAVGLPKSTTGRVPSSILV